MIIFLGRYQKDVEFFKSYHLQLPVNWCWAQVNDRSTLDLTWAQFRRTLSTFPFPESEKGDFLITKLAHNYFS